MARMLVASDGKLQLRRRSGTSHTCAEVGFMWCCDAKIVLLWCHSGGSRVACGESVDKYNVLFFSGTGVQ